MSTLPRVRLQRLVPTTDDTVDAAFAFALTLLAVVGFRNALGGWSFLSVGLLAAAAGLATAHVLWRVAVPGVLALVIAIVVFLTAAGPIALRGDATAGFLPSLEAVRSVIDGSVSGWKRLLTTLPPSGELGNLLAVPYLCCFVAAGASYSLARRTQRLMVCLAPGLVVLALSVLFGTRRPFSVLLQGGVLAAVALGWLAVRRSRERVAVIQSHGSRRSAAGLVMLAVTVLLGVVVGPRLPMADANDRFVLRDETVPPFDPREFGSPLNGFRAYLTGNLKDEVLFTVQGLPAGDHFVQLAVMDDYDGVVFRVSPTGGTQSGRFIRVGDEVPSDATGEERTVTFVVDQLPGVWMPTTGEVGSVRWNGTGERRERLRSAFRLNTESSAGIVPVSGGWAPGDSFTVTERERPVLSAEEVETAGIDRSVAVTPSPLPPGVESIIAIATKGVVLPFAQAKALEREFQAGWYSTGDQAAGEVASPPGHSYARLDVFTMGVPLGNDEQYAAAMALAARSLGMPARVVMGFEVESTGGTVAVVGSMVTAQVEIAFEGVGWYRFDPTAANPPEIEPQPRKEPVFESQEVPPPPLSPPTDERFEPPLDEERERQETIIDPPPADGEIGNVLAIAAASIAGATVLVSPLAAIVLLKRRRASKRRAASRPADRISGGWQEFVDAARDFRLPVAAVGTHAEIASAVGVAEARVLAVETDARVFGHREATVDDASAYWAHVESTMLVLQSRHTTMQRLRARISIRSLRPQDRAQ